MFQRLLQYDRLKNQDFYDRDTYENIFQDPKSKMGKMLSYGIVICIVVSVFVVVLETVPGMMVNYFWQFFAIDLVVSLIFLTEYVYRFLRSQSKGKFVFSFFNTIDFLSFAPFFIALIFPWLTNLNVLRVLRLLRILRLFEVSAKSPIAIGFLKTIREYHREYKAIFTLFFSVLVIISSFVYFVEQSVNPSFASIPHALWWGLVTMTTVGYGDVIPITLAWKLFGVALILLGPILLAVISSITILVFMDVAEAQKITGTKVCATCKTRNNEHANFCHICGEQHFVEHHHDENIVEKIPLVGKLFSKR